MKINWVNRKGGDRFPVNRWEEQVIVRLSTEVDIRRCRISIVSPVDPDVKCRVSKNEYQIECPHSPPKLQNSENYQKN